MKRRALARYAVDLSVIAAALGVAVAAEGTARTLAIAGAATAVLLLLLRVRRDPDVSWRAGAWFAVPTAACAALALALFAPDADRVEHVPFEPPRAEDSSDSTQACLRRPAVDAYLRTVHERILDAWPASSQVPPGEEIVLEIRVLPAGAITQPRVLTASSDRLGRAALAALRAAVPFDALESELECLAARPVRLSFSTHE